jgi:hypothetical protein
MTAHFASYFEGCSLVSTIIGTALRELMFYVCKSRHDCNLLVHFSLGRSRDWTEYFSVCRTLICLWRRTFPYTARCDKTSLWTYGLNQVHVCDTADSRMFCGLTAHSDGVSSYLPASNGRFREWWIRHRKDAFLATRVKNSIAIDW